MNYITSNSNPQRVEQRLGLHQRFLVLRGRVGVGDDAAAHGDVGLAVLDDHGADGEVELDGAVGGEVADRAAVGASANGFQLFDDLHGADLRRPGDAAAGEGGAQQ